MIVRELRALHPNKPALIGHYDNPAAFAKYAAELNAQEYAIYSPINAIKVELITGLNQPPAPGRATGEEFIARRTDLPYDIDAVRSKNQTATDEQRACARQMADRIVTYWLQRGVAPRIVDSGNGYQVRVPIDLPNDANSTALVKGVLEAHKREFDTPGAKLDVLFDAPRIMRVPGYKNWKGDGPHRVVTLMQDASGTATREMLESICPVPAQPMSGLSISSQNDYPKAAENKDVVERVLGYSLEWREARAPHLWMADLDEELCPNADKHSQGNVKGTFVVTISRDGKIGAKCNHSNCSEIQWAHVRAKLEEKTSRKARLRLVTFSDIQTKEINWQFRGKTAIGHITTLNGDPGAKKSFLSLDFAARVSTGRPGPDGEPNPFPPCSVLVLTREDGLADTVKPRFLAAGGDPRKLTSVAFDGSDETAAIKLEDQLSELGQIMRPDTRLIIFDPLIDFIKAQQNHEAEVRDVLTKLKNFAEQRALAIIGINHLNKKSDLDAIHRTMGAKGFVGVARMNFLVGKDEGGNLHLCSLKNNLWADEGSLTFKLEDATVEDGHVTVHKVGRVVWTGKGQLTADELTAPKGKTAQNRAADWLKGYLQPVGTKKPAKELYTAGIKEGFSEDQLKRALGKVAEHEHTKTMPATTVWWLPISEAGF